MLALVVASATEPAETYALYCATCHGMTGLGDGPMGLTLDPKPAAFASPEFWVDARTDTRLLTAILEGGMSVGGSSTMMAWKGVIPRGEAKALVAWLRQTRGEPPAEPGPEVEALAL